MAGTSQTHLSSSCLGVGRLPHVEQTSPENLTKESPIFHASVFNDAFQGRFSPFSHLTVGFRPAKDQMWPTVGARSMSMCAASPAEMTGPIALTVRAQAATESSSALVQASRTAWMVSSMLPISPFAQVMT